MSTKEEEAAVEGSDEELTDRLLESAEKKLNK